MNEPSHSWCLKTSLVTFLLAILVVPAQGFSQPTCAAREAGEALAENSMMIGVARGKVGTIDFSTKYAGMTVMLDGVLCTPAGEPIPGTEISLFRYAISPDAAEGEDLDEPSVDDLEFASGNPFIRIGKRENVTTTDGAFRFMALPAGRVALSVDWSRIPDVPFVMWQVQWRPGPVMAISRNVP